MESKNIKQMISVLVLAALLIHAYNAVAVDISKDRVLEEGVFDLRDVTDIYRLDGQWYFWENNFVGPDSLDEHGWGSAKKIRVPGKWNASQTLTDMPRGMGRGTYGLTLLTDPGSHIGIRLPNIFTNYKLYLNDKLVLQHGDLFSEKGDPTPVIKTQMIYFMPMALETTLILQVSNHATVRGGLVNPIVIGELNEMIRYRSNALMQDVFIVGSVLLFVAYHLMLYALGRRDKARLWLIIFSVAIGMLTMHHPGNETIRTYLIPNKLWVSVPKSIQFSLALMTLSFNKTVVALFPQTPPKWLNKGIVMLTSLMVVVIVLTPVYELSYLFRFMIFGVGFSIITALYCLIKALNSRFEGALIQMFAVLMIGATGLYDYIINYHTLQSYKSSLLPVGFLGFLVITSYVVSMKYSHAFDALEASNVSLRHKQMQLIQQGQLASVGHLASGMAHEINNPLGYVKSNTGALKTCIEDLLDLFKATSPPSLEALQTLKDECDEIFSDTDQGIMRIQTIINDLNTYASTEDSKEMSRVDLGPTLDLAVRLFKLNLTTTIDLSLDIEDLTPVKANDKAIGQVVLNLLINASEAIKAKYVGQGGGLIRVTTAVDSSCLCIEITDNGQGISQEDLESIFHPFYTSKAVGQGLGLGLSIANEIVLRHKGHIVVTSDLGYGSSFTVKLPVDI